MSAINEWGRPERHGGNLFAAAEYFRRPLEQWLDLSAALNPRAYAFTLDEKSFRKFPDEDGAIEQAANSAYGSAFSLAVPGSQWAIQHLPRLRKSPSRVAIPAIGYREHLLQWQRCGHDCSFYHSLEQIDDEIYRGNIDVLVVINPNNPSAERVAPDRLLELHSLLQAKGGWLVVDEAFADIDPAISVAPCSHKPGLIVLRSFGKFFGLPGIRLGFALAEPLLLQQLRDELGVWPLNSAANLVGTMALRDLSWQQQARDLLQGDAARLASFLGEYFSEQAVCNAGLFCSLTADLGSSAVIHEQLARQGVWTRRVDAAPCQGEFSARKAEGIIRFGLPGSDYAWDSLISAVQTIDR